MPSATTGIMHVADFVTGRNAGRSSLTYESLNTVPELPCTQVERIVAFVVFLKQFVVESGRVSKLSTFVAAFWFVPSSLHAIGVERFILVVCVMMLC